MPIFLTVPGQILFWAAAVANFALLGRAVAYARKHAPPMKTKSESAASSRVLTLVGPGGVVVALLLGYTSTGLLPDWSYYLGWVIGVVGLALFVWGSSTLGRYYSPDVVIYQAHQLQEKGPYRFVRHPIYAGIFLSLVGVGFLVQSWIAVVFMVVVVGSVFGHRITVEEKVLVNEFGEQYTSYSRRVKRLVPFIY
jgi:protein-S-isoprenylcysteine O-methyltransferase Ste14